MGKIVNDELWKSPGHPGMIIVSTNGFVRNDGRLVMGRGAAYQATQKIPGIDKEAGEKVLDAGKTYGFLPVRMPKAEEKKLGFGIFQVKFHWNQPAVLDLILHSVQCLTEFALYYHDWQFRMNYPGIGNGGLNPEEVRPLLDPLPDNVTIVHKGEVTPSGEACIYPGMTMKGILLEVAGCLEKGQYQVAVDYLRSLGFTDPEGQVEAVRAMTKEWRDLGKRKEKEEKVRQLSYS